MGSPQSMPSPSLHEYHTMLVNYSAERVNNPDPFSAPQPPPQPSVLDLLHWIAALRGDLADIPERISDLVNGHSPRVEEETLRSRFRCLAELGFDFGAVHQMVAGARHNHIHYGDSASCSIRHDFPSDVASRFSSSCGLVPTVHPHSEDTDERACYVSPHVQNHGSDSPPLTSPTTHQSSTSRFQPQPAPVHRHRPWNVAPAKTLATTSDSETGFPSGIAHTDRNCPSLQASPTTVNPTTPSTSASASEVPSPGATLAEPEHLVLFRVPVTAPGAVDHTPTMADAHPQAAQWRTEAPPPPYSYALPSPQPEVHPDSSWSWSSSSGIDRDANVCATAMRVPPPEVRLITTIPWRESSLYHPPGWIQVPAALRDTPRDRSYGNGRSGLRSRDNGSGRATTSRSLSTGKGAPTVAW